MRQCSGMPPERLACSYWAFSVGYYDASLVGTPTAAVARSGSSPKMRIKPLASFATLTHDVHDVRAWAVRVLREPFSYVVFSPSHDLVHISCLSEIPLRGVRGDIRIDIAGVCRR